MDHLTLILIVSRFQNSAAQYVLNPWLLIPNTIVALAIFRPFRIPYNDNLILPLLVLYPPYF